MMTKGVYPAAAGERAMKVQEVILRAIDGRLKWYEAAEILGISDRQMRRWKQRYERWGYGGLFDRRCRRPSPKRVPVETVRQVLTLYRERSVDCNVLHFQEKLQTGHGIDLSYTWVKTALQTTGLVSKASRRGTHRQARPRRPLPGMLLHTDASTRAWIPGRDGTQDLIAVLDDATSAAYYAQFVPQESTGYDAGGSQGRHRGAGPLLQPLRGQGQSLCHDPHGTQPASAPADQGADPDRARVPTTGHRADPGAFAPGAGPDGTSVGDVARAAAAGIALGRDHHAGGGQSVPARHLAAVPPPDLDGSSRRRRHGLCALHRRAARAHLRAPA